MTLAKEIVDGFHNNERFWICDYRLRGVSQSPIRSIPPTLVEIRGNGEAKRKFYYSESHARAVGVTGKVIARTISLVDNTGWRSHSGTLLQAFRTEAECVACYIEQRNVAQIMLNDYAAEVAADVEVFAAETDEFNIRLESIQSLA